MNFRLKTSKLTADILKDLQNSTQLTPNVLARLAISLSLAQAELPNDVVSDSSGLEFNRHTLTGQHDLVFRCLIAQRHSRQVSDEEYFPDMIKKHLDRGIVLLLNEYKYAGNYERFVKSLVRLGESNDLS